MSAPFEPKDEPPSCAPKGYDIRNNKLWQDLHDLARKYDDIRESVFLTILVQGPPGLGKTYLAETHINCAHTNLMLVRPHAAQLIDVLYRYRNQRFVLFFDDTDYIFDSPGVIDILKIACNPHITRVIVDPRKGKEGKGRFVFNGRLIFITNKNLMTLGLQGFDSKVRAGLEALRSRFHRFASLSFSRAECYHYSCWLGCMGDETLGGHMFRQMMWQPKGQPARHLGIARSNEVLKWFAEQYHRLREVSPRTLKILAEFRLKLPDAWQAAADAELCDAEPAKQPDGTRYAPMREVWQIPESTKPKVRDLLKKERVEAKVPTPAEPKAAEPPAPAPEPMPEPVPPKPEPPPAPVETPEQEMKRLQARLNALAKAKARADAKAKAKPKVAAKPKAKAKTVLTKKAAKKPTAKGAPDAGVGDEGTSQS